MQAFTDGRTPESADEIWLVEHTPVFTQGQAGKTEHLLDPGGIPVVQSDRGGQVTYHGPGQLVAYLLIDLRRAKLGVRQLVSLIEKSIIALLEGYDIKANAEPKAPGVYVDGRKMLRWACVCAMAAAFMVSVSMSTWTWNPSPASTPAVIPDLPSLSWWMKGDHQTWTV